MRVQPAEDIVRYSLPDSWAAWCKEETSQPYFRQLRAFLVEERRYHDVFPAEEDVFSAFQETPLDQVRVLLLGQDPYHKPGQAHGLCFSVRVGVKPPPSLANIFTELNRDIGCPLPRHGYLRSWARQGVLMLNTVLTVRAHEALSHRGRGWEMFTDAVIRRVAEKTAPVLFVLWGKPARLKIRLIDQRRHCIIQSAHPSPLSARRGFLGSKPFSRINEFLVRSGNRPIDWCLPELP